MIRKLKTAIQAVNGEQTGGDQLTCVFVDNGLLRLNEAEEVLSMFRKSYNINLIYADEAELFLNALEGVSDPEIKRKNAGRRLETSLQKTKKDQTKDRRSQPNRHLTSRN